MNVKESVENVIVMQSARQGKDTEFVSAFTDFREMDGVVKVIDPIVSNFYPVHKKLEMAHERCGIILQENL